MENRIYDEKNGLWYEKQGDYYLPCLSLPEEETQPIGVWGQRRLRYLKQHRKAFYTSLLTSGKLNSHLTEIDNQAKELFFRLVKQLAEKEGVTEKFKAENQMEWVGLMNNIRSRATEVVNDEIIYTVCSAENLHGQAGKDDPPKSFWKNYDLYRRKHFSLEVFTSASGLSEAMIKFYLEKIAE